MATIEIVKKEGLCIGCGLCSFVCPEKAIEMCWHDRLTWIPKLDGSKCSNCGICIRTCPTSPECISEYTRKAVMAGDRFGLTGSKANFLAYDTNPDNRIHSASGGALTAILSYLLDTGEVDGVIASEVKSAPIGKPHYSLRTIRSSKELEALGPSVLDKAFRGEL